MDRDTAPPATLGVDVGGTFTDVALWDGATITVTKVSTTTDDQSKGVVDGATRIASGLPSTADLVHGTTAATNALLERRGAETLLVTDAGFESILEIARQDRPSLYDPFADRPAPLVTPAHRTGVTVDDSTTVEEIDELVAALAATVRGDRIGAVAICLLYSYVDPAREQRLAARLAEHVDVPVSVSSEVVAEFREYERMSTTVLNAFLSPEVRKYMDNLRDRARSTGRLRDPAVMRSSGGLTSLERAARLPASILLSGPAGGVVATAALGETMDVETLISFDMGGTSTDVCRIEEGRPEVTYQREIDGQPCLMPAVAVHTVGAGGGSIAWTDEGGALRVGPRSAGADPGPACYGRGGTAPTVTDANVVLGRIDPEGQLADAVSLRADLAEAALARLGERIGLDAVSTALGVLKVVESHMAHAIRTVSVERGADPRRAVLVAFGGAGGLHATALARELDMRGVVVPPFAGVFSAFGLLLSPARSDVGVTINLTPDAAEGSGAASRAADELEARARSLLDRARAQLSHDSGRDAVETAAYVDMRYVGQSHETPVPYTVGESWDTLRRRYDGLHARRNGFSRPDDEVEAVTVRAEAVGEAALTIDDVPPWQPLDDVDPRRGRRLVTTADGPRPVDVWWRPSMPVGTSIEGPAVVDEGEATVYLGTGETAVVGTTGALEISWQR